MIIDCSKLCGGFVEDECTSGAIAGTGPRVILLNYTDIDRTASTKNTADANIIETIVLKEGAVGYEVESLPNATVGEDTLNVGTYRNNHQHNLTVRIFKKSAAAKKFVNCTTNARVVAIVQNNDEGDLGNTKYEIYGWDAGLKLNDLSSTTEMEDQVAYLLTFGSDTVAQENSLPKSFFNTDVATTDAAVEALLAPGE